MRNQPLTKFLGISVLILLSIFFQNCSKAGNSDSENAAPAAPTDSSSPPVISPPNTTLVAKGNRLIGVDIVNVTAANSFTQNVADAKLLGGSYMLLDLQWNQIEPGSVNATDCTAGTYVDPSNTLALLNATLPATGLSLTLNFNPSTTNIWSAAGFQANDLIGNPAQAATQTKINLMICRYNNALQFVLSKLPDVKIIGLQIGNEIDYLSQATNVNFWVNYWSFLAGTSTYAKTLRTNAVLTPLPIGVTSTVPAVNGDKGAIVKSGLDTLNQTLADYLAVNYYPFSGVVGLQSAVDQILPNITNLVTQAKTKPIRIQEFGCQSGAISTSSETLQTSCYTTLFSAWDQFSSKITHVEFLRMTDLIHSDASSLAFNYTNPATPPADFIDYIETLGLKYSDGRQKPVFLKIRTEIQSRGW